MGALKPRPLKAYASVAIVVVFVPIVFGAPAMLVFIPPPVLLAPATFAGFVQLAALMISLSAVASVLLDGLVKLMLGMLDAPLASVGIFGMSTRHCGEPQSC